MPLTAKGEKILAAMKEKYGERGEEVFYRSKNAGTISGVDAGEVEREGEGLREQLRAAQEGMSNARTSAAKASYKAECDRLTAKIADMEKGDAAAVAGKPASPVADISKADAAAIIGRIDAMGAHVAGHVGKAASAPRSQTHADSPLARAEAALADAIHADMTQAEYERRLRGILVGGGTGPVQPRDPSTNPKPPKDPFIGWDSKKKDAAGETDIQQYQREVGGIMTEGQEEGRALLEKLKGGGERGDADVVIRKMPDGRWGVFKRGDATGAAGQDSPLEKAEAQLEEMKLHSKLGDAFMKHLDMCEKKLDEFDGYARTGEVESQQPMTR